MLCNSLLQPIKQRVHFIQLYEVHLWKVLEHSQRTLQNQCFDAGSQSSFVTGLGSQQSWEAGSSQTAKPKSLWEGQLCPGLASRKWWGQKSAWSFSGAETPMAELWGIISWDTEPGACSGKAMESFLRTANCVKQLGIICFSSLAFACSVVIPNRWRTQ